MRLKHFNLSVGGQIFKSFSDTSRIRIMYLLYRNRYVCISDLELILDFSQTKISRHLTYLKNSDLVTYKKIDQWTFYSIKEEITDFVELIFNYLGKDHDLQNDQQIYETLFSNRELAINKLQAKDRNFFNNFNPKR